MQFELDGTGVPTHWYNIAADLPSMPPPPLHPATGEPVGPDDLAPLFPMALIEQEVSTERLIEIPEAVADVYRMWRPTPLRRATRFEAALDTPARIFFKYEGVSPVGSHKPNTAVPQAYYNAQSGISRLVTETGAGQWGSALSFAASLFGLTCEIWQVAASFASKPDRRTAIETWGGVVHSSPSKLTEAGRAILEQDPDSPGSLGIAISEAVEMAVSDPDTRYALGSVLNHVLLHQTVIGQEALAQLVEADATPDVAIGCAGGGSNFAGLAFPLIAANLAEDLDCRIRAVEPTACPTMTEGEYRYDSGDTAGLTPRMKMHTLGHDFIPPPIHAGGLRYHGMAPLVSHALDTGLIEAEAYGQRDCFEAARLFARTEGFIPAPESSHAVAATVAEAKRAADAGEERTILFLLSGHGHFDMAFYADGGPDFDT